VLHHVSIEALLGHKIKPLLGLPSYDTIASFRAMQCNTIMEILKPDPYATGRWLGSLAWTFGAWVHSYKISTRSWTNVWAFVKRMMPSISLFIGMMILGLTMHGICIWEALISMHFQSLNLGSRNRSTTILDNQLDTCLWICTRRIPP
jgi:hypothetical protein